MDDVDFSSLSSVLQAVQDANAAGTVLPESFYNSAVQGLSSNPGGNPEYYLFSSDIDNPQTAVVGDLYVDGNGRYSVLSDLPSSAFIEDQATLDAIQRTLDNGQTINGYSTLADVTGAATTNSLFGQTSAIYAGYASGDVYAVLPDSADPGRIFGQVELEALINNPAVSSVNGIPVEDLRAVGVDGAFQAVKANSGFATSFLLAEAYSSGVIQTTGALDSYYQTAGIDPTSDDFYRMAVDGKAFADSNNIPGGFDFVGSSAVFRTLDAAGTAGDIVGMALVAGQVAALYNAGRVDEAQDLLADSAVSFAGGAAGGYAGGVIALAILGILVPEPSTTAAGLVVIAGALAGGIGGEALANGIYEELQRRMSEGETLGPEDLIDVVRSAEGNCFAAGTLIVMADGNERPIETIKPGDLVASYDADGALVAGEVVNTQVRLAPSVLDVHGLKVTPGHVVLCGDGLFDGFHVPILNVLLSDGAMVRHDGSKVRISTDAEIGSTFDAFINLNVAASADDLRQGIYMQARIRVGTKIVGQGGIRVLDRITAEGFEFDRETGLVRRGEGQWTRLAWFGRVPKPQDYVLHQSKVSLETLAQDPMEPFYQAALLGDGSSQSLKGS